MNTQLGDKEKELLARVPANGTAVGNVALKKELAWEDEEYWTVRDGLIEKKKLALGRGRGGSVRLVLEAGVPVQDVDQREQQEEKCEHDLYEPIKKVLAEKWSRDLALEEWFVQITAKQGRRDTGGTWTRPDVVVVYVSTYQYVPGKFVDVTTFEVKDETSLNVTAVYEALAHLRAATRAHVLAVIPEDKRDSLSKVIDETAAEASRHGIGFILTSDAENYDAWEFRVEASRSEPDPARLDEFIETQILDENKKKLRKWSK
jgi:hypothetical protein